MSDKVVPITNEVSNDIIDVDLSITKKKKFRFDKDNNRILELNVSDMNIIRRTSEAYPKLQELQSKAANIMDGIELPEDATENEEVVSESINTMAERLSEIDNEMRDLIDYIFNAEVSKVAAPEGSMYDPFEGQYRFEHIIALLINQYESNLSTEFKKMEKQFNKHTAKYTKSRSRGK